MNYKVSVIIPIYNVEKYLEESVLSVLNQTLREIEIICINDGSQDPSFEILKKLQKSFKRRIKVINKTNGGYGAACNLGIELSKGEYIGIVEPDDFINREMYEKLYKLAKENDADIVKSSFMEFKENETPNKAHWSRDYKMPEGKVFTLKEFPQFLYFHPSIWSCIYKREFLNKNKIRFKEAKGAGWVDNPFQVETLICAKKLCYTDEAFYNYRLSNPTSSSNKVNITNPFDRSDEVHSILKNKKINDKEILGNLYKRELGYINEILERVPDSLFEFAKKKINQMAKRMDEKIINGYKEINSFEKELYSSCLTEEKIEAFRSRIEKVNDGVKIVRS